MVLRVQVRSLRRAGVEVSTTLLIKLIFKISFGQAISWPLGIGPELTSAQKLWLRFQLHDLFESIVFTDLVPPLVGDLDVLTAHQHHVTDVEEINPVQTVAP